MASALSRLPCLAAGRLVGLGVNLFAAADIARRQNCSNIRYLGFRIY